LVVISNVRFKFLSTHISRTSGWECQGFSEVKGSVEAQSSMILIVAIKDKF